VQIAAGLAHLTANSIASRGGPEAVGRAVPPSWRHFGAGRHHPTARTQWEQAIERADRELGIDEVDLEQAGHAFLDALDPKEVLADLSGQPPAACEDRSSRVETSSRPGSHSRSRPPDAGCFDRRYGASYPPAFSVH
jgi:hypothetical protein